MLTKQIFKPSPKMLKVYREAPFAKFRLLEGAVRSSKSYLTNDIAIKEIQALPACNVLLSGYSISSAARNVMAEWKEMIDPQDYGLFRMRREGKDEFMQIGWRGLRDKKFYIRGAGKEHDFKQIQGATFGYWLADELARHSENFVDMTMTRLSPPYAKALWTTNADSPFHYIKTRFLDNLDLYREDANGFSLYKTWKFFLDDNPSLSEEYIESLKRLYTGVFYRRFIDALWVIAEGAIYDFFERQHILFKLPTAKFHVVGIDYGTGNPTSMILFGVNHDSRPKIWAEREYYWDSKVENRQKTDEEYAVDLEDFLKAANVEPRRIYVDPSAASFKLVLKKKLFRGVKDATNEVLDGIRTQARMLKSREYGVYYKCKHTIKDYDGYVWDPKAQLRGEDKPLKVNDHTKDAERYTIHSMFGRQVIDYSRLTKW